MSVMREGASIAVLTHEESIFENESFYLNVFIPFWRESGHKLTIVRGTDKWVPADLAILHVDRTVIPDEYLELVNRYPKVINGRVRDISKRAVSKNLLQQGDAWLGSVIVKTNLNAGGVPEWMSRRRRYLHLLDMLEIERQRPFSCRQFLFPDEYRVFSSPAEVPAGVWDNPYLVVERFFSEQQDDLFALRTWVFLGDQETSSRVFSSSPLVKAATIVAREEVEVPRDLRQMRRELGFDYGKFDYVVHDGKSILFDANRTPALPPERLREQLLPHFSRLAQGLAAFIDGAQQ